ncbi:MAG: TonB-dependent receptor [Bryobacterales bacterium]|nr:TonB-dependent receptor [Bryobacterales bacterium]
MMLSTRSRICLRQCGLILLVLATLALKPAVAQEYRATVQGIVTDPSKVAVPGAKVTLTNQNTGVAAGAETDTHGRYLFELVIPGTYLLRAEATGFDIYEMKDVLVQVRSDITIDPSLQLKGTTSSVTVVESATTVQFNSSSVDMTINQTMLKELPVMARNPFQLATLDPMVVNRYTGAYASANANPFFMWSSSTIDVGGANSRQNDLFVDGTPVQIGPKGSYTPPMDAVQEFSVQQNTVDAEYGHTAGGVLSVGMKSGTNEFHGTAYYFGRNPALNAAVNSITHQPSTSRNHIWGATLGNPIIRKKLFAFTSYEQWKMNEPITNIFTLPTDLERTGNFSKTLNAIGLPQSIFDPWSTAVNPANGAVTRTPFPGNIIPAANLDRTAVRFMKDVWAPNSPGDTLMGLENFKKTFPMKTKYLNFSERIDFNPSDSWRIFGRYSQVNTDLAAERYSGSVAQRDANGGIMNNKNFAADAVWIKDPRTVFTFRFGYASLADNYDSPPSEISEQQLAEFWPNNAWYKPYLNGLPKLYYPALYVGDAIFGQDLYWIQTPRHYSGHASVRSTQGAHSLKAGLETRFHFGDVHMPNPMAFGFSPTPTADTFENPNWALTGDSWATFLVGAPEAGIASYIAPQQTRVRFYGLYFQDDYKLSRRITLNLGLRYENETAPRDPQNRLTRALDLNDPIPEFQKTPPQFHPLVQQMFGKPFTYNGAFHFTDSANPYKYNANPHVFLPRLGVSIRINDRTSLRAGWARFVVPPLVVSRTITDDPGYYGFSQSTPLAPETLGVPGARLANPFPSGVLAPVGKAYGRYTQLGDNVTWDSPTFRTGVNDRINFSLQRFIGAGILADATYFMTISRDLPYNKNFNLMDPQLLYTYKVAAEQPAPNPFFGTYSEATFPGILRNYPYVPATYQLRPYPQYLDLIQRNTPGIEDRYHALSLSLRKQFSQGYQFQWNYAYARETTGAFFNDIDQFADRFTMIDSNNPRHRMTFAGTAELPVGKGRRYAATAPKIVDLLIGGWSASPVLFITSGQYLRFGPAIASGDPSISNPTRDRYFDAAKFQILPSYTPRTNPWQYDGVRGSPNWNLDLAVSKYFPLTEAIKLEFRMESYNLTNSFVPGLPNMSVGSPQFGRSVTQANLGRQMQYTLRLHF